MEDVWPEVNRFTKSRELLPEAEIKQILALHKAGATWEKLAEERGMNVRTLKKKIGLK